MLVVFLLPQPAHADPGWYDANWLYRKKITIDNTKVTANLSDFPVLINRTDADWKDTANGGHVGQSDGGDILFTSSDGTSKLDHEIERYTPSTGELIAWVEVPTLSASADTKIYIYYGNAVAADQWNVAGTWDSNFIGVWHLGEGSGTTTADSLNQHNGSLVNSPTWVDGKIGKALQFTNSGAKRVEIPDPDQGLNPSYVTAEGWVYWDAVTTIRQPWGKSVHAGGSGKAQHGLFTQGSKLRARFETVGGKLNVDGTYPSTSVWYYYAVTYDGTTGRVYIDGIEVASGTLSSTLKSAGTDRFQIAGEIDRANYILDGMVDEVRISDIARSGDWIATEYNNQNSPSTFYSVGSEEVSPPDISNTPNNYGFGTLSEGSTSETGLIYFTVTNNSGFAVNITIGGTDMTGGVTWTLSDTATPGADTYGLKAGLEGGSYTVIVKKNIPYNTLVSGLAASSTQRWGLQLLAPTSFSDGGSKSGTVTLTATQA